MRRAGMIMAAGLLIVLVAGCNGPGFTEQARNGITFYCPGAGNIDFGDQGVRAGLEAAGYRGQVATVVWTVSFNPAIDQAVKINARAGAAQLARAIERYIDEYPGRPVNVVGLSAGTGVAVFALERLGPKYKVDNVVLLASSLSYDYDVGPALQRVKGRIYNYYSSKDAVLAGPMKVFGTIDGRFGVDGAGAVGLYAAKKNDRVVNVRWRPDYQRYGYYGGHLDVTAPEFVRAELSSHILASGAANAGAHATAASRPPRVLQVDDPG
jgi:pimeloyl-ACP methyl ester carboxylesterase